MHCVGLENPLQGMNRLGIHLSLWRVWVQSSALELTIKQTMTPIESSKYAIVCSAGYIANTDRSVQRLCRARMD